MDRRCLSTSKKLTGKGKLGEGIPLETAALTLSFA